MEVRGGGPGIGARSSLGCWEGSLHASTLRLAGKDSSRRGGRKDRRRTRHIPDRVNGTFKGPEVGRGRCETGRGKAWEAGAGEESGVLESSECFDPKGKGCGRAGKTGRPGDRGLSGLTQECGLRPVGR